MTQREEAVRQSRWSQDMAGGIFMMAIAVLLFLKGQDLAFGSLRAIGPGFLPVSLSLILGGLGLLLALTALSGKSERLSGWSFRGIIFALGAVIVFGLAVRPLGLLVAGPVTVVVAGFASRETRFVETMVFGIVMTAFCVSLFKIGLNLPIPVLPWLLGY